MLPWYVLDQMPYIAMTLAALLFREKTIRCHDIAVMAIWSHGLTAEGVAMGLGSTPIVPYERLDGRCGTVIRYHWPARNPTVLLRQGHFTRI